MKDASQALVVPLNVLALAVNAKDAHDATPYFSGATTVFSDQLGPNQAFLGANVNRSLNQSAAQSLEAGVHLHWALPDALTKALDSDGGLAFPAAPNRWLVHRLVISGGKAVRTSWVVLSDALADDPPAGQAVITLPTYTTASGQDYQYCGQTQPFTQQWAEPALAAGLDFETLTGQKLTAVSSGHPAFASFYPNCRGVFGFTDSLSDLPQGAGATLMYAVTGWYSDTGNDPLDGGLALDKAQDKLGWTWRDTSQIAHPAPSRSMYHGTVQGIAWHPDATYLPDYSNQPPEIALDLSLGNNPPESMAAYLQNKLQPDVPYFQTLLSAYFEGLTGKLAQPAPHQLATLADELHENGFKAIKAEYIYTVVRSGVDNAGRRVSARVEPDLLPPQLGDALNLLNFYAQSVQLLQASLDNDKWQLFADWYRIFMAVTSQQQGAYQIAYQKYKGLGDQAQQLVDASRTLQEQFDAVNAQLPHGCALEKTAAPRYWQANDLVFLLSGAALPPATRYGGDGLYDANGYLVCRLRGQLVGGATANKVTVGPGAFASAALPTPNALPEPDLCNALLAESMILNAGLLSALTGAALGYDDVRAALSGASTRLALAGIPPSPIGLANWNGNPWVPLFAWWQVQFEPVFATTDSGRKQLFDYPQDFFTSQFKVEQDNGGAIGYAPPSNPADGTFGQTYEGMSILSTSAVNGFARQLGTSTDPLLRQCLQAIKQQNMVMQSLSGLNTAMLTQAQDLQLNVKVPAASPYAALTGAIAQAIGYASHGPNFNGYYNPVRAGYLKVALTLVDMFGQKTTVQPTTISIAQSLVARWQDKAVPDVAWLPPRLSQASRLLFRFLAADGNAYEEMNLHPATTPVCGWLLPNHLNGSLFVYDTQGASLGSLVLSDDKRRILWQPAPGNMATIDQDVETVMHDQQPQLRALVVALAKGSPQYFADFMSAVDSVNGFVEPQDISSNNDLAVLIGRPVALVQSGLTLELQGTPNCNQQMAVLNLDLKANPLAETDNGFTGVDFPVVLGNLQDLNDGLIGYFKFGQDDYDLTRFYSAGAPEGASSGVQSPAQDTVTLTPYPGAGNANAVRAFASEKLLMLVDPRAAVHATTGILPTKSIRIPSDMYADTLRALEMTFLTAPILSGSSALCLPLSNRSGYQWSWVQERLSGQTPHWETRADIAPAAPAGMWTYTPQTVLDGWLRLNPDLLAFELLDADGKALLVQGMNDKLALNLTNRQGRPLTFEPGALVGEGSPAGGSVIYLHFGSAVPQAAVPKIALQADGWRFACLSDRVYGAYWVASPVQELALDGGASLTFQVSQLEVDTDKQQITICADYYGITNVNDGVYRELLAVRRAKETA